MKLYFYVLSQHSYRTGKIIGKTCGVLRAKDEDQALKKLNNKIGENTSLCSLDEFSPVKGYEFSVYIS